MQPANPNIFHFRYMGNYPMPTLTLKPTLISQLLNRNNLVSIKKHKLQIQQTHTKKKIK